MKRCIFALALLAAGCAAPGPGDTAARGAGQVIAAMKAACGGEAWDRVESWHETGIVDLPGRPGLPHEVWHNMRTLKTG